MKLLLLAAGLVFASGLASAFHIEAAATHLMLGEPFRFEFVGAGPTVRYWIEHEGSVLLTPRRTGAAIKEFTPKAPGLYTLFAQSNGEESSQEFSVGTPKPVYESREIASRKAASWLLAAVSVLVCIATLWAKG
jgi:hypothetical protein